MVPIQGGMGAVLARDELIIRRLFRRGIGALEAVRASLRGVDDSRCARRFGGIDEAKFGAPTVR